MTPRTLVGVGAAAVVLAVSPVLEGAASTSFTWHMLQHQVLVLVAGPLLGAAAGRAIARRRPRGGVPGWVQATVVAAGVLHVSALLVWHVPPAYDAAVATTAVHGVEHVTLLGTAVLLWAGVWVVREHAGHPGASLVALVMVGLASAGLGVVLLMASQPLYAAYATAAGAVVDQRVGGALMKVGGLGLHAGGAVWLTVSWLARLDHPLAVDA